MTLMPYGDVPVGVLCERWEGAKPRRLRTFHKPAAYDGIPAHAFVYADEDDLRLAVVLARKAARCDA